MAKRKYTSLDMVRMAIFARENKKLLGLDLLTEYNKTFPELSEEEKTQNLKNWLNKNI